MVTARRVVVQAKGGDVGAADGSTGERSTFLVLGATGQTGRPFVDLLLGRGHRVRALVRNPARLGDRAAELDVRQGSITDPLDLDALVEGVDFVVMMIGDREAQQHAEVNTAFVRRLVPAMRRQGVRRLLYQAGGFSTPPGQRLPLFLRVIRGTIARPYLGQHRDNEAVMRYLSDEARDLEWMVHRAGLRPGEGSRGVLQRSDRFISVASFEDCADYSLRLITGDDGVHTCSGSRYAKRR